MSNCGESAQSTNHLTDRSTLDMGKSVTNRGERRQRKHQHKKELKSAVKHDGLIITPQGMDIILQFDPKSGKEWNSTAELAEHHLTSILSQFEAKMHVPQWRSKVTDGMLRFLWEARCAAVKTNEELNGQTSSDALDFVNVFHLLVQFRDDVLSGSFTEAFEAAWSTVEAPDVSAKQERARQHQQEQIVRRMVRRALARAALDHARPIPNRKNDEELSTVSARDARDARDESELLLAIEQGRAQDRRRQELIEQHSS